MGAINIIIDGVSYCKRRSLIPYPADDGNAASYLSRREPAPELQIVPAPCYASACLPIAAVDNMFPLLLLLWEQSGGIGLVSVQSISTRLLGRTSTASGTRSSNNVRTRSTVRVRTCSIAIRKTNDTSSERMFGE